MNEIGFWPFHGPPSLYPWPAQSVVLDSRVANEPTDSSPRSGLVQLHENLGLKINNNIKS
jgi:hypothetical protein